MVEIKLQFENKIEKDKFLGQFSDGWGENLIEFEYDKRKKYKNCDVFKITWFEGIDYRTAQEVIDNIF